jgi:thiamine-monophosphate kinase
VADEFDIIERLRKAVAPRAGVEVGIGDDTAVLRSGIDDDPRTLVMVDLLAEGTHFTIPPATPRLVGRKALAVNLSDIAAMAGRPESAFVAVALPRARGEAFAEELLAGIHELAEEFDVCLAGGDTNIWDGPLVVSVTLLGRPTGSGPVLRSGAQPGDWLMVTGPLGGSLSGRHLTFTPRVAAGQALHATVELHALIDLSDGLSRDVRHITCEQGYGAVIEAAMVPVHSDVPRDLPADERTRRALNDGEDFELLLAVSAEEGQRLLSSPPVGCSLFTVGAVTDSTDRVELLWPDGRREPLEPHGYEHRF